MPFTVLYHPDVALKDISILPKNIRERIALAIEVRLTEHPEKYGAPLRNTLKGYWKLRVGDYRVVFRIAGKEVIVFAIMHRKEVYKYIQKRI